MEPGAEGSRALSRRRRGIATLLLALTLAMAVASAVWQLLTRDVAVDFFALRGFGAVMSVLMAVAGWLIVVRVPRNVIGVILFAAGVLGTIQTAAAGYATFSYDAHGATLPLTAASVWFANWGWVLIIGPLGTLVLTLFPDGRIETRGRRALVTFEVLAITVFAAAMATAPGQAGEVPIGVENPWPLSVAANDALTIIGGPALLVSVLLSIASLAGRFRRATGERRQQMKWLTYAGAVAAVALSGTLVIEFAFPGEGAGQFAALAVMLGFAGIPVATGVAVLRYGLYEIDVVINKTVFYGVLAVFITAIYLAVLLGIGAIVGNEADTGLTVAATAIVAIAIQPLRARATRLANRLVFGKRSTPHEALSSFSARLSDQTTEALPELARLMTEATAADRAAVWVAVGEQLRAVSAWPVGATPDAVTLNGTDPVVPGADHVFPVRHDGVLLGALSVSVPPNDPLTPSEERLLGDLSSHAGLLLRNTRLIEDLRASRQRIVAAADAERRTIERNLHDGAQQHLVALKVKLRLAKSQAEDRDAIVAALDGLGEDVQVAIDELRALAHGIFPPVLVERGLVAALEAAAGRASIPTTIEAGDLLRHPRDTEAAVYFCCLEALQNAAKHAGDGARARITLRQDDDLLRFTIADDGAGFDPGSFVSGAGFTNMRDRIGAIGGTIEVTSAPGRGTSIDGSVPVR